MGKHIKEFVVILLAVLLIREFLAQAYNIPSASMEPTLLIGDFILVNKLVYRVSEPLRGDIVVFKYPVDKRTDFIKRVIAKEGDTVEFVELLDEKTGILIYKVIVNGREYALTYRGKRELSRGTCYEYEETIYRDNGEVLKHDVCFKNKLYKLTGMLRDALEPYPCLRKGEGNLCKKFVVPKGYYFVMGDNRDNSEDSRVWGFVPRENVVGKAFVIYLSGETPSLTPGDVASSPVVELLYAIRQMVYALLHPRWDRIGKPLIH